MKGYSYEELQLRSVDLGSVAAIKGCSYEGIYPLRVTLIKSYSFERF